MCKCFVVPFVGLCEASFMVRVPLLECVLRATYVCSGVCGFVCRFGGRDGGFVKNCICEAFLFYWTFRCYSAITLTPFLSVLASFFHMLLQDLGVV